MVGDVAHLLGLFASRATVGIGEAAYATIAPALLADYFPKHGAGRIFAIFYMAIPVGAALGYVIGGAVSQQWGWRAAFFVAGIPGLALALWVLRVPDPPRGAMDESASSHSASTVAPAERPGVLNAMRRTALVYVELARQGSYALTVLGYAAYTFAVGGLAFWMPTFLERVRAVPVSQATTGFGAIVVVTGFVGTFLGGWLADLRPALYATGVSVGVGGRDLAGGAGRRRQPDVQIAARLLPGTGGRGAVAVHVHRSINSVIVSLVSPMQRASAVALSVLAIHLLGDVLSPPLIGGLSDRTSLGDAVLLVPVAVAVSGLLVDRRSAALSA